MKKLIASSKRLNQTPQLKTQHQQRGVAAYVSFLRSPVFADSCGIYEVGISFIYDGTWRFFEKDLIRVHRINEKSADSFRRISREGKRLEGSGRGGGG